MPNRICYFFFFGLIINIHIYNLFYICTGTHACMGFVPDNKLIRIRIVKSAMTATSEEDRHTKQTRQEERVGVEFAGNTRTQWEAGHTYWT